LKKGGLTKPVASRRISEILSASVLLKMAHFVYKGPLFGCQFMNGR